MEIVGRLTADAKLNNLKDERQVVNFSVAVNDSYKPKDSDEPKKLTNYFNCSYWVNPQIAQHLTKGTLVELYGRIGINAWTSTDGEAKASLNFHVNSIKLHGKSKENASSETGATSMSDKDSKAAVTTGGGQPADSDDLPF